MTDLIEKLAYSYSPGPSVVFVALGFLYSIFIAIFIHKKSGSVIGLGKTTLICMLLAVVWGVLVMFTSVIGILGFDLAEKLFGHGVLPIVEFNTSILLADIIGTILFTVVISKIGKINISILPTLIIALLLPISVSVLFGTLLGGLISAGMPSVTGVGYIDLILTCLVWQLAMTIYIFNKQRIPDKL